VTLRSGTRRRRSAVDGSTLLHFLAAFHGFACLEYFDHLNWISREARDEVFDAQVALLILSMGASKPA
jgi:hypothetical protein